MTYKPKWKAYQVAKREEAKALVKAQPFKMAGDCVSAPTGTKHRMAQWAQWKIETLAKQQFPNAKFSLANSEARVYGNRVTFYKLTTMPKPEMDRLAKLCGMFGSVFDGERASAATMADKLVKSLGQTWETLFSKPALDAEELISIQIPSWTLE